MLKKDIWKHLNSRLSHWWNSSILVANFSMQNEDQLPSFMGLAAVGWMGIKCRQLIE